MSKPISWRPSEEAARALEGLKTRTGLKLSDLMNRLVLVAARNPDINADNDHGSASVALERMKAAGFQTARGVDRERIAEFQRKAGMTVTTRRSGGDDEKAG